jgi:hypothetical protein
MGLSFLFFKPVRNNTFRSKSEPSKHLKINVSQTTLHNKFYFLLHQNGFSCELSPQKKKKKKDYSVNNNATQFCEISHTVTCKQLAM